MTQLTAATFRPQVGTLTADVLENDRIGLKSTLFFYIELPLAPIEIEGELETSSVVLDWIRLDVEALSQLEGNEFRFPVNPEDGYIDGSMYLFNVHNPVDVTRLRFSFLSEETIRVSIDARIDFAFEGPEELGVIEVAWETLLTYEREAINDAFREAREKAAQ